MSIFPSLAAIPYVPTWTTNGVAPVLGNGTLQGFYALDGCFIEFEIFFLAGTTTTFGTGVFIFTLPPVPALATLYNVPNAPALPTYVSDSAVGQYSATSLLFSATQIYIVPLGAPNGLTGNNPFVWKAGDNLVVNGRYRQT